VQVEGIALNAQRARQRRARRDGTALIRVEEVKIGREPVANGMQLPL
jgi:iron(III) transport system ATP-binding protein